MKFFKSYPSELVSEIDHRRISLGDDPALFDPIQNGPSQQGDPVIKIYSGIFLWHTQSIAGTRKAAIASTFIDEDRVSRILRLEVLRRYPVLPYAGICTSIDYIFTGSNYYHFLVDSLPRLWSLKHPEFSARRSPLVLLNSIVPSQYREFAKLIFPEARFAVLPRYIRILCKNYVHLPYLSKDRIGFAPEDSQTSGGFIPNEFLEFLRMRVCELAGKQAGPLSDRVYIKRGETSVRRVLNESEIETKFESMGFACVDLAKMTLLEQAMLFLNAKVIVGVHGAGFANLLYCGDAKTKVFEIYPSSNGAQHYYTLYAAAIGLDYHSYILNEKHISSDLTIPNDFINFVGERL